MNTKRDLEYRRANGFFEVGDWVIDTVSSQLFKIMEIDGDLFVTQFRFWCNLKFQRHATDAEIKAGRRLEPVEELVEMGNDLDGVSVFNCTRKEAKDRMHSLKENSFQVGDKVVLTKEGTYGFIIEIVGRMHVPKMYRVKILDTGIFGPEMENNIRLATPQEIIAGHRINET